MPEPKAPNLRRREVLEWLASEGIDERQFEKCIESGLIERIVITPTSRGYYLKSAIILHILKPFREAEARLSSGRRVAAQPHQT